MKTSDFNFELPQELIAQTPLERRDASRLMTLDKVTGETGHCHFYDLPKFLNPGDCLVLNDSRVLPARLIGHRPTGGVCEVLLLTDKGDGVWECLVRPGRKLRPGTQVIFGDGELTAQVEQELERVMDAVITVFEHHKRGEVKQFTQRDFEEELQEQLGEKVVAHDKISLLLDIFTARVETNSAFTPARSQISVLQRRKQAGREEPGYLVMGSNYLRTKSALQRMLNSFRPQKELTYEAYRPILKDRPIDGMPLFKLLELLDLASYEIRGGEKAQVFVRINDPGKIRALAANGTYRNVILQEIHRRHKASETLLQAFFTTELSQQDRWELIEEYFLGHEAVVSARLGLPEEG